MAGKRINWSGIGNGIYTKTSNAVAFIFRLEVLGVTFCLSYAAASIHNEVKEATENGFNKDLEKQLKDIGSLERDYILSGGYAVVMIEKINDKRTETSYNFREKNVSIDGPGNADAVIQFNAYANKESLNRALAAGCLIAKKAPNLLSEFKKEHDREYSKSSTLLSYSTSFQQKYCK